MVSRPSLVPASETLRPRGPGLCLSVFPPDHSKHHLSQATNTISLFTPSRQTLWGPASLMPEAPSLPACSSDTSWYQSAPSLSCRMPGLRALAVFLANALCPHPPGMDTCINVACACMLDSLESTAHPVSPTSPAPQQPSPHSLHRLHSLASQTNFQGRICPRHHLVCPSAACSAPSSTSCSPTTRPTGHPAEVCG